MTCPFVRTFLLHWLNALAEDKEMDEPGDGPSIPAKIRAIPVQIPPVSGAIAGAG